MHSSGLYDKQKKPMLEEKYKICFPRSYVSNNKYRIFWTPKEGFPRAMSNEDVATEDMGFVRTSRSDFITGKTDPGAGGLNYMYKLRDSA